MKISICIPQYNRINFLLKNLSIISGQTYKNIEIVISDDCSTDQTEDEILKLIPKYKFPIIYQKNKRNIGYSANLRRSMELASGEYCLILGNDDTTYSNDAVQILVNFIQQNNYPDIGFCNFAEADNPEQVIKRTHKSVILNSGVDVALKYYGCFSFVGGLVFKKTIFEKANTDKYDWGVFIQIFLAVKIIVEGGILFSINEPIVLKDIYFGDEPRVSYKDRLKKKWKDFRIITGGLPDAAIAAIDGFENTQNFSKNAFTVLYKMYAYTLPFWILDYKSNGAIVDSIGITLGLSPFRNGALMKKVKFHHKVFLVFAYCLFSFSALIIPSFIFLMLKNKIYHFRRKYLK
jgi:glycosyltransferase involved in cell wall biosynthesis